MTLLARSKYPKDALRDVAGAALSLLGVAYPGESGPIRAPPETPGSREPRAARQGLEQAGLSCRAQPRQRSDLSRWR